MKETAEASYTDLKQKLNQYGKRVYLKNALKAIFLRCCVNGLVCN